MEASNRMDSCPKSIGNKDAWDHAKEREYEGERGVFCRSG